MDAAVFAAFRGELEKDAGSLARRLPGLLPNMVSSARSAESLAGKDALQYAQSKVNLNRWGHAGVVDPGLAAETKQTAQSALQSHVQKTQGYATKGAVPEVSRTQQAMAQHLDLRAKNPELAAGVAAGRRAQVAQAATRAPGAAPASYIGAPVPKPVVAPRPTLAARQATLSREHAQMLML